MRLLSVNVALPRAIPYRGRTVWTGIFKEPVAGRIRVRPLNLDGDRQADLRYHGGPDKAVYAYDRANTDYWEARFERTLPDGAFGENLTVRGMPEDEVAIGDRYRVGTAVLEVSEPRSPCYKLGVKMGSTSFFADFLRTGKTGFYLRVIEAGEVGAGDAITVVSRDAEAVTVAETSRFLFSKRRDPQVARRALRVASLSAGLRSAFAAAIPDGGP